MGVINTYFIGHLGNENQVAGAGMANMLNNIVARSVLYGVTDSLSTFISQSYGNHDYYMCGVYLNRARILIFIIYTIILLPLQFAYLFFELIGLSGDAALYSQHYLNICLFGVLFNTLGAANKSLLNCMEHQREPMIIQMIVTVLHFFICKILIEYIGLGIFGPPIAISISNINNFVMMHFTTSFIIKDDKIKQAWFYPNRNSYKIRSLVDYMKVGLPSIGVLCLEWWSFEIMSLIAAGLSVQSIAI